MGTQLGTVNLGNGVNLQPSYYNNGNLNFGWDLMKQQPKIKSVRIEIEPDKVEQGAEWIAEAMSHGYQVIATYHKHTVLGSNDPDDLMHAANWWADNYETLGGNFLINLMNEWGNHDISAANYASAYNQAIAVVRSVYTDYIIIDLPGWGQDTHIAYAAIKTSHTVITDKKIALSAHVYKSSWNKVTGTFLTKEDLKKLSDTGRPCLIGEFGTGNTGGCNWKDCVDYARTHGWTVIGWCWNGDGNNLNMVSPAWVNNSGADDFTKSAYFDTIYNRL